MTAHIPFEKHFRKRSRSYDSVVGDWWIRKSNDRAHRIAYRNIVQFIRKNCPVQPETIIDYACGNGLLLPLLKEEFASATIIGLDGSQKMLSKASRLNPSIRFMRTPLPNFQLDLSNADVVVFTFPNMNFTVPRHTTHTYEITRIAKLLDAMQETNRVHTATEMLRLRVLAENIRHLLKRGGFWFKEEYSGIPREKLTPTAQWRLLFTEAAFSGSIDGKIFRDRFKFVGSQFFRSRVVTDVYDQSLNREDRNGGYFVSMFRAL